MEVVLNGQKVICNAPITLEQLLADQKMIKAGIAVAVNHEVVPKLSWNNTSINSKDEILIITATQGG